MDEVIANARHARLDVDRLGRMLGEEGQVSVPHHGGRLVIDLTAIDRVPLRVSLTSYVSALVLGVQAVGRPDLGGTPMQRAVVKAALSPRSINVFRTLAHPNTFHIWDGLVPVSAALSGKRLDLEAVWDVSAFRDDISSAYGPTPPAHWRPVLAQPKRFLCDYVRACDEAWRAVQPVFGVYRRLLDREAERIGAAVIRGTLPEMLAAACPGARLREGHLLLPTRRTKHLRIGQRGLAFGPIVAAVQRGGHNFEGNEITGLWYPIPGMGRLFDHPLLHSTPSRPDGLVALLGRPRAMLLRHLDRPATVGQLAVLVHTGPSAITYHVDALVAAGLVERHRRGRHMLIIRTDRGDRLLDLYLR